MPHVDRPAARDAHASHDRLLVAQLAAGDVTPDERARGISLVASCELCSALAADLTALQEATRILPAPSRTRDFQLTDADAARIRPGGWRGFVAKLSGLQVATSRPIAAGMVTLGLAGLLFLALPGPFTSGLPASAPQEASGRSSTKSGDATPGAESGTGVTSAGAPVAPDSSPSALPRPAFGGGPAVQGGSQATGNQDTGASAGGGGGVANPAPSDRPAPAGAQASAPLPSSYLVALGSIALIALGSGFLVLGWWARRTRRI